MKTRHVVSATAVAALLAAGCQSPVAAQSQITQPADSPAPIIVVSPPATVPPLAPVATTAAVVPAVRSPVAPEPDPQPTAAIHSPVRAVLIVQNHESDDFQEALSNLGDWVSSAIAGPQLRPIDPNDAFGDNQNRGPWGENLPLSSAVRLAEGLGATGLIAAAIDTAAVDTPDQGESFEVVMGMTIQAKSVPDAGTLFGVSHTVRSQAYLPGELKAKRKAIYADIAERLARETAAKFAERARHASWEATPAETVSVAFSSNVPGADILIDGISYGTTVQPNVPVVVKVSRGVHNLRMDAGSLRLESQRQRAVMFQGDQTWTFVAEPNEAGIRLRREDAKFDALLRNLEEGRATEREVRLLVAGGYAKYLSSSHTCLDGMPQALDNPFPTSPVPLAPGAGPASEEALKAVENFGERR